MKLKKYSSAERTAILDLVEAETERRETDDNLPRIERGLVNLLHTFSDLVLAEREKKKASS